MADFNPDIYFPKYRKVKLILMSLIAVFLILTLYFDYIENDIMIIFAAIFLLETGIVVALFTRKYYNWIFAFIGLVCFGLLLKHNRAPLSGTSILIGFGGLGFTSFFSAFAFLKRFPHNNFLKYIGFTSSIVLFFVSMGLLWRNLHWPFAGPVLTAGVAIFIPFLFGFVFTLPNANFINWNKEERTIFFRAIIVPMVFVFIICVLLIVFPDFWTSIVRGKFYQFGIHHIDLIAR